jgi:hypothetical protein
MTFGRRLVRTRSHRKSIGLTLGRSSLLELEFHRIETKEYDTRESGSPYRPG